MAELFYVDSKVIWRGKKCVAVIGWFGQLQLQRAEREDRFILIRWVLTFAGQHTKAVCEMSTLFFLLEILGVHNGKISHCYVTLFLKFVDIWLCSGIL
jgi:hypothetical protein